MFFKKLIYGKRYFFYVRYDIALDFFRNSDYISNHILYNGKPPDDLEIVLDFLEKDGMITRTNSGITITEKGNLMRHTGGYKRQLLKDRITFFSIVLGIILGIIGFIAIFR